MLNLSWKRKNKYIYSKRIEQQRRMTTGKTKLNPEEREQLREKKQRIKDKFEVNNMGEMFE